MKREWRKTLRRALHDFEQFALEVVHDRARGWKAGWLGALLAGLSWVFSGLVQTRLALYRWRIFRAQHLGVLVVVVGNLSVGGTGKTPVVERFACSLAERGRHVAILSRGYKRRSEPAWRKAWRWLVQGVEPIPLVVSDGRQVLADSRAAGDEPYMLARNLPGVCVVVDRNRVRAGAYAIEHLGCDTLILDDGFQYLALQEHLQLLLIDATNPFGNGFLLPRGILREPVKHLRRASHVFVTKSDGTLPPAVAAALRRHRPDLEPIHCRHAPRYLQEVHGAGRHPLEALARRRVAALSAIAAPAGFEAFLRQHGAELVHVERFVDHHRFSNEELEDFFEDARAAGAEWAVTTEKDAVRIPAGPSALPFWFLRVEIELLRGAADFDAAVDRICFPGQGLGRRTAVFGNEMPIRP